MSSVPALKKVFEALLRESTEFFTAEHDEPARDRETVDRLYSLIRQLVAASRHAPRFERFLSYLMGTTQIEAHYSLHAIQMTSLVLLTLRGKRMKPREEEEIAAAAFFADFGQRAAWLSYESDHAQTTISHFKSFQFTWWTLTIERLIQSHHAISLDPSPHRVFSIVAHYLALTRGTGTDQTPESLLLPARAVDAIMNDGTLDMEGKKWFLSALSVYPLGSWVRLNSGETGVVVANHPGNPLRPVVAIGRSKSLSEGGVERYLFEEIDLKKELTRFVGGEALAGPFQEALFELADQWIPYWDAIAPEQLYEESAGTSPEPLTAGAKRSDPLPPSGPTEASADPAPNAGAAIPSHPLVQETISPALPSMAAPSRPPPPPASPEVVLKLLLAVDDKCRRLMPLCKTLASLDDPLAKPLQEFLAAWAARLEAGRRTGITSSSPLSELESSLEALSRMEIRLQEKTGRAFLRAGWNHRQNGQSAEACTSFERAHAESPALWEALLSLDIARQKS